MPHRPTKLKRRALATALIAGATCFAGAHADGTADTDDKTVTPFELGRVVVQGKQGTDTNDAPTGEAVVTRADLDKFNLDTVGKAVAIVPGVTLSDNSRNESMVYVRGFDPRQVPVFLDGIPQYVPYDGYIDFGRFTTFDLGEIRVVKGAASLLYGPNTLGGAINLVSRKPTQPLEGDVLIGAGSGGERKGAVNLGMRQNAWYMQAGASWLEADSFPLPKGFKDYKATPTDTGDNRENADHDDRRASIKLGYAPSERSEFAVGYSRQDGEKGNPVYTGQQTGGVRYWRWPWRDKESIYFIGTQGLGEQTDLKMRVYEDKYSNGLDGYTNGSYTTQLNNTSFPSVYDDKTRGASMELANRSISRNDLHLALHYKEDSHRDSNPNSPVKNYRDVTTSVALEDNIALDNGYSLRLGGSHEKREAKEVYFWPTGATSADNGLIELQRETGANGQLFTSYSHKTRFPTIKDRYSAKMGTALPNPDLKPETSRNVELGWRGQPWTGSHTEIALFENHIDDLIQDMQVPSTACGGTTCKQAQNVGRTRNRGVELSLQQNFAGSGESGISYTWMERDNLENPNVLLTNSPRQRLFSYVQWEFTSHWKAQVTGEAEQGRVVTYTGPGNHNGFLNLPGYATWGAKLVWSPLRNLDVEVGGRNLADKWIELTEGYPQPGRTWFANIGYRL